MVRELLEMLGEELSSLKREGTTRIAVSEENLDTLRRLAARGKSVSPAPEKKELPPPQIPSAQPERTSLPAENFAHSAPAPAKAPEPEKPKLPPPPVFTLPAGDRETQRAWLRDLVLACPECNAHVKPGKKVVFGVGDVNADIFFCCDAPEAEDEEQGEPFLGPAGQLLTKIIGAMGLSREKVYIGNIMNWRPEMPTPYGNRPPTGEEMNFCLPYLLAQLEIVKPKVIVALGGTAIDGLLGADPARTVGKIHGKWQTFNGIPLMPTYHPSYLLRSNSNKSKRMVWEDMLLVMEKIGLPVSDRQRGYFSDKK